MRIIKPSYKIEAILPSEDELLRYLEVQGRTCYKSEDRISPDSAEKFVRGILKTDARERMRQVIIDTLYDTLQSGSTYEPEEVADSMMEQVFAILDDSPHESVIEHASMCVRFICDRGVTHELVRHRLAAFSQESTRYCNYSKGKFGGELTFILPCFWGDQFEGWPQQMPTGPAHEWVRAMEKAEEQYLELIRMGAKPQEARDVLPNSLKTEIVMTANVREWRHIFRLRTSKKAHPQMRELMCPMLAEARSRIPVIFDDVGTTEL